MFSIWPCMVCLAYFERQMADMLADIGENIRDGVSIDSTNGIVHIDDSAVIEPFVHIIGPAYIGPNATFDMAHTSENIPGYALIHLGHARKPNTTSYFQGPKPSLQLCRRFCTRSKSESWSWC